MKQHLTEIRKQFDAIWSSKEHGAALEVITPFTTTNRKFVSVFISAQGDETVISDGGFIHDGMYGLDVPNWKLEDRIAPFLRYSAAYEHYSSAYEISQTRSKAGTLFHYKKVSDPIHIASAVLDLAMFIAAVVSEIDRITD